MDICSLVTISTRLGAKMLASSPFGFGSHRVPRACECSVSEIGPYANAIDCTHTHAERAPPYTHVMRGQYARYISIFEHIQTYPTVPFRLQTRVCVACSANVVCPLSAHRK